MGLHAHSYLLLQFSLDTGSSDSTKFSAKFGAKYRLINQKLPKNDEYIMQKLLFGLILYVPVNSFSVMSGLVTLCLISTK